MEIEVNGFLLPRPIDRPLFGLLNEMKTSEMEHAIFISLAITTLGFLPWERLLSIEFRDLALATLMNGTIGLTGLIFLLLFLPIRLLKFRGWISALSMLVIPLLMTIAGFVWLISLPGPAMWQDISIFRNGDSYLVLEGVVYGRDSVNMPRN